VWLTPVTNFKQIPVAIFLQLIFKVHDVQQRINVYFRGSEVYMVRNQISYTLC
jgi:hypothetical protein